MGLNIGAGPIVVEVKGRNRFGADLVIVPILAANLLFPLKGVFREVEGGLCLLF